MILWRFDTIKIKFNMKIVIPFGHYTIKQETLNTREKSKKIKCRKFKNYIEFTWWYRLTF